MVREGGEHAAEAGGSGGGGRSGLLPHGPQHLQAVTAAAPVA